MALAQTFQVPEEVPTWEAWEAPPLPDDWIAVRGAGFTLHGARAHLGLMDRLIAHGDQAVPRIAGELGIPLGGEVEVYLAGSQEEFQRLQPGNPPVWADGTAYPNLGIIFLRHPSLRGGGARPLEQVLDHELVHVLLGGSSRPTLRRAGFRRGSPRSTRVRSARRSRSGSPAARSVGGRCPWSRSPRAFRLTASSPTWPTPSRPTSSCGSAAATASRRCATSCGRWGRG